VFFHLTIDKIKCALNNFSKSGSKFLFATYNPNINRNSIENDVTTWFTKEKKGLNYGGYRPIDLTLPPILLPPPTSKVYGGEKGNYMGLWTLPFPIFEKDVNGDSLVCN
jgi:hypothetical protein